MRTNVVIFIVLVIFAVGVFSSILEDQHKEKLRQIRNGCVVESGINPYEIGIAKRAIGPVKKLVRASHCIVQRLAEQKDDQTVQEIIERTQVAIRESDLSRVLERVVGECQKILGAEVCNKVVEIAGLVIENIRSASLRQG